MCRRSNPYPATQVVTNTPVPRSCPNASCGCLWSTATMAENMFGAPLPRASRVTPAMFSDNLIWFELVS